MKKYLMTGIAALALCAGFTSCSHDLSEPSQEEINEVNAQKVTDTYNRAFIAKFGQPASNQDWGFSSSYVSGARQTRANAGVDYPATSTGINANANEWADPEKEFGGWIVPDALTEGQKTRVRAYFQANPNLTFEDPEWRHFFVQQVYKGGSAQAGNSSENITAADGTSVYNSDNMNLLTVGANHQHINNFNGGTYGVNGIGGASSVSVLDNGQSVGGTSHSDQIMLMVNIDDTSCFGYHETGSSTHHDNKAAIVSAAVIDAWAAANGNPGEAVTDKWNRSFLGFDLAIKEGAEAYATNESGDVIYADYSQAPTSPAYAWDGEKVICMKEIIEKSDEYGNKWNELGELLDTYKTMGVGYLTTNENFYVAADKKTLTGEYSTGSELEQTIFTAEGMENVLVFKDVKVPGAQNNKAHVLNLKLIKDLIANDYLPVMNKSLTEWVKVGKSDGYFTDWIVTLTEAQRNVVVEYETRIIGEDLTPGETDWDFNDVVFAVDFSGTTANCTLLAAGGTLPLRIYTVANETNPDQNYVEVHNLFGVDTNVMVNTGGISTTVNKKPTFSVTGVDPSKRGKDIIIKVNKGTSAAPNWVELKAEQGDPAAKLAVGKNFKICTERQNINTVYTRFTDWVADKGVIWY